MWKIEGMTMRWRRVWSYGTVTLFANRPDALFALKPSSGKVEKRTYQKSATLPIHTLSVVLSAHLLLCISCLWPVDKISCAFPLSPHYVRLVASSTSLLTFSVCWFFSFSASTNDGKSSLICQICSLDCCFRFRPLSLLCWHSFVFINDLIICMCTHAAQSHAHTHGDLCASAVNRLLI